MTQQTETSIMRTRTQELLHIRCTGGQTIKKNIYLRESQYKNVLAQSELKIRSNFTFTAMKKLLQSHVNSWEWIKSVEHLYYIYIYVCLLKLMMIKNVKHHDNISEMYEHSRILFKISYILYIFFYLSQVGVLSSCTVKMSRNSIV